MGNIIYFNGIILFKTKMKFAFLIGASQAITLWTTTGQIAYVEDDAEEMNVQLNDWTAGVSGQLGAGEYSRVTPARFSADSDDIFMRSMINNYATELNDAPKDAPPHPSGHFILTESEAKAAAQEVLCTHKAICGEALAGYLGTYWAKAWGHFDVNRVGNIEVIKAPQLMRFLSSDQYMSLQ